MILKQKVSLFLLILLIASCVPYFSAQAANVVFSFANKWGGTGYQYVYSVVADSSGNSYITGEFGGTIDLDPGPGTSNVTSGAGNDDTYIVKIDSSGNFVWAKTLTSAAYVWGDTLAFDSSGNLYLLGGFGGTVDFDPGAGTANLTSAGAADVYILKLDSSGNFVWAKKVGGAVSGDNPGNLTVDSSGNVLVTGVFAGTVDFDPGAGTANLASAGNTDVFILKLDSAGDYVWAKGFGNATDYDSVQAIAADTSNNVYVTGGFDHTIDFDPGAGTTNLTSAGNNDVYISKLDSSGNFVWAKKVGGASGSEAGYTIVLDSSNNVIVGGSFGAVIDFDPGAGIYNLTPVGTYDAFIFKLDSSGAFVSATQYGGVSSGAGSYNMKIDASDNLYIFSNFYGTVDFDPGSGVNSIASFNDSTDAYAMKLDSSYTVQWLKRFGGTDTDYQVTGTVDTNGVVYVTGVFNATADFDPGSGTANLTATLSTDNIFLVKLTPTTTPTVSTSAASSISLTEAVLNGTISSIGGVTVTNRGFQYGLSGALDHTREQTGSYSTGSFSSSLTNLGCGKTYSFRSYATNTEGTSYGSTTTFSTTDCPGVVAIPSFNSGGGGSSSSNIPPIQPINPIIPISPATPTTPTSPELSSGGNTLILSGRSVKLPTNPAVYYINTYNKKLIYPNWLSYLSYNKTISDIQTITKQELDSYPTILYIKSDPNGIVYKLTNLTKQALTQSACDRLKVTTEDVLLISQTQMDSYKKGSNILK